MDQAHPDRHSGAIERQLAVAYLSPPQLGYATITRRRLLEFVAAGGDAPVTVVSGEPAAGKTSLLVQLLAMDRWRDRTAVWITVPPGTDDEIRFWEYLLAAIAAAGVGVDDLRAALGDRQPPTDDWLTVLANRLADSGSRLALVIDDLHELATAGAVGSLGRLFDILSGDCSALVATRVVPDWPLARWRMSGRVTEVTSRDLAVTVEEARELLESSGIDVDDEDVDRLVARTEGWLGGVRLAALALQRHSDASELIAQFSADNELVSTYLLRAVLDRQDDDLRQFLYDVSVLDTMSAALCDAIREADDSAELLERCRAANIFVTRVGGAVGPYRLHSLVRELLRAELERSDPDRFVEINRRASFAFAEAGDVERAIVHAVAAGETGRVDRLVIASAPELGHQGRFDELGRWAALVKRSGGVDSSATILALASTLVFAGEGTEALRVLDELEEPRTQSGRAGHSDLLRASAHMVRGDVELLPVVGRRLGREVGDPTASGHRPIIGAGMFFEGVGAFIEGRLDDAAALFVLADEPANRPPPPGYIAVKSWAALVALRRGDTAFAERCVRAAADRRAELESSDTAAFATALLTSAEMAWEQNRTDEAAALFARARRSVPPMPWQAVLVECSRSRLTASLGSPSDALNDLSEISRLVLSREGSPLLRALVAERAADICLRAGDVDQALGWVDTHERCRVGVLPWATRIRLAVAVDPSSCGEVTTEALAATEPLPLRVETLLAAANIDDDHVARSRVAEALGLAESGRMIRRFLDAGPRVVASVGELAFDPRRAGGVDFSRFFAAEVAAACAASIRQVGPAPVVDELVDQLSAREIEVLRLLGTGKSYTEIGSELFVSRNTVKSHVQHIYTKLGASGRGPAVELGRRLGLI